MRYETNNSWIVFSVVGNEDEIVEVDFQMIKLTATILKFGAQGEKTGWSYVVIPSEVAEQLCPGNSKGFRTKGKIDDYRFSGKSLIPLGYGEFIFTLDGKIRKAIGKRAGAKIELEIAYDKTSYQIN